MLEKVQEEVNKLLNKDKSGHGMDHINRVLNLSLKFASKENADINIVSLIALLHDVDDYKLFGETSENLSNARRIMEIANIDAETEQIVCEQLNKIGYSKRLKGIMPTTIEGKIVSDADMCDSLGAISIIRTYAYNIDKGNAFFNKNIFPIEDLTYEKYKNNKDTTAVCHFFEKVLKLKNLMLTDSGKEEALKRDQIVIDFLYHYFDEEMVPEWTEYLNNYLEKIRKNKL